MGEQETRAPATSTSARPDYAGNLDDRTLSLIADVPPAGQPLGTHRLLDMAVVIRSKDAGINRLTFDIIFTSGENYEAALRSNVFSKDNVARILRLPAERVVGTFFVDTCNAIKISIERPNISASRTSATCSARSSNPPSTAHRIPSCAGRAPRPLASPLTILALSGAHDQTVIEHVLSRLRDIGITDVFGVPGDYSFAVNDAICNDPQIRWVGCCERTERRLRRRRLCPHQGRRRRLHHLWRRRAQRHQRHCRRLCRASAGVPSGRHAQHGDAVGPQADASHAGQWRLRPVPPHDRAGGCGARRHDARQRRLRDRAPDLRGALSSPAGLHGLPGRPRQPAGARRRRSRSPCRPATRQP